MTPVSCSIRWRPILAILLLAVTAFAQDNPTGLLTENPLDAIHQELVDALDGAGLPFTRGQEDRITFVLEESRRASELLFGDVMNFSNGPPQGENLDRAMAGIAWMNQDFSERVREHLDEDQIAVWDAYLGEREDEVAEDSGTAGTSQQVQQIRVNRNPFTSENQFSGSASSGGSYGYSSGSGIQTRIFQRGGTGAWHGNAGFTFRDESLNARNPFGANKPPYQQRITSLGISGPLLRNRLTFGGNYNHSDSDQADTVNATTLDGPVSIGFTRPQRSRSGNVRGTLQLTERQSLDFNANMQRLRYEKQGVGGFSLPERAIDLEYGYENFNGTHLWFASERWVQEINFNTNSNHEDYAPVTPGRSISVLGAFNGGGGSNRGSYRSRSSYLGGLWIYSGDRWNVRTGFHFERPTLDNRDEGNFDGTFTFSDLESYREGRPILYTQNGGEPGFRYSQTEWSLYYQNEYQATDRLTVFAGFRYERQSNLDDGNNLDPRLGVAYALDNSTVIRAGVGVFHMRVWSSLEYNLRRLDGTRQFEIIITDPSYPDPFQSGDVTVTPPSTRRVRAEDLVAPYSVNSSVQIERSFPRNLFVTASFDYQRANHLLRSRNLNAPLPGAAERPFPDEGNVWRLESTGFSTFKATRVTMRQRFSIFNVNATYSWEVDGSVVTNFSAPTDNFNLDSDYATTRRHNISAGVNNRLFWDVYLNTNISYRTGNWYTVTTGRDDNGDGVTNDRPPGVPRYTEKGPHQGNVSFNLTKSVPLGEGNGGPSMNFRANFANAFNRTNYGTPIGILTSPYFGQSLSASNPREISLEMRFQF